VQEARVALLRRPAVWLALLLALDLGLQAWTLHRGWAGNPFLRMPQSDAQEYWDWSARIAGGELVGSGPFFSAPLYPYFLGLVRACGGGLFTVYVLQTALRTLTAWLLFRVATRRFGRPAFGLAAAALFLALGEPAYFGHRILNSSLQLFLIAALCAVIQSADERRTRPRLAGAGFLLGLNVLANPTMLLLVPALPLWLGWRTRAGWAASAVVGAAAALAIAPATAHNWLATRDSAAGPELILVSAQSGITYAHGNSAAAHGYYAPVPGVAVERIRQNASAYEVARAATGEDGWKNVNSYFFRLGLDWNLAHPAEALRLHAQKAAYLFFGRHYSDIANATWEQRDPSLPAPVHWPGGGLPSNWLLVSALAGAGFLLARRGAHGVCDALLLALPMAVVIVFWYSPRYRLPIAVPACLLAPYGLAALAALRPRALAIAAAGAAALAPIGAEFAFRTTGFDHAEMYHAEYEMHVGEALMNLALPDQAYDRFENSLKLGQEQAITYEYMGNMRRDSGKLRQQRNDLAGADRAYQDALRHYTRAIELNPERFFAFVGRGTILIHLGDMQSGLRDVRRGLEIARAQNHPNAADIEAYLRSIGG